MSERKRQPLGPRAHASNGNGVKRNKNDNLRPPWKKGQGGRPPGALNHTTRAVRDTIMAAADMMGGVDGMVKWIKKHEDNEFAFWSEMYLGMAPLQMNTRSEHTEVVYQSYEEIRRAFIERGAPEDKIDALLQYKMRLPKLRGDGRSE
jgi:hypothetical protein